MSVKVEIASISELLGCTGALTLFALMAQVSVVLILTANLFLFVLSVPLLVVGTVAYVVVEAINILTGRHFKQLVWISDTLTGCFRYYYCDWKQRNEEFLKVCTVWLVDQLNSASEPSRGVDPLPSEMRNNVSEEDEEEETTDDDIRRSTDRDNVNIHGSIHGVLKSDIAERALKHFNFKAAKSCTAHHLWLLKTFIKLRLRKSDILLHTGKDKGTTPFSEGRAEEIYDGMVETVAKYATAKGCVYTPTD